MAVTLNLAVDVRVKRCEAAHMRIGELARLTGTTPRALRYYEEQGLLHPQRRPSGYREYAPDSQYTVRHIQLLLSAGLNTATIAEIVPCIPDETTVLAPTCQELLDLLAEERDRIDAQIAGLTGAKDVLERIMNTSARNGEQGV
ncbi:MerR family transcriptional regulator [Dactylosporangium matsuzakiense]|uniref:MerR family transcriptional regulator n=2 Tax=Dactylosporangium matsuzakiense TaxID=53360 RepID=A0A9W6KQ57_9ACTN|nr:MerR family transcriptional regulator [Dactylosporangium matsuzakiense]